MRFPYFLFFILTVTLIFSGCRKEKGNVFLPNEGTQNFDGNGYTDTFTLITKTIREDSLKTDSLSNNIIGIINDPVFGQYKATSFFQFLLPQLGNVLSGTLDSVVIFMQYTTPTSSFPMTYYGDINSTVDMNFHELTEDMSSSKSHSNNGYNYNPVPFGNFSGKLNIQDSITIRESGGNIRIPPCLKITLPNTNPLAIKLFNASSGDLSSQASFLNYFKGIAVTPASVPASGSGVINAFNMLNAFSKIRVYYNDTLQSDFRVYQTESRRLSKYEISNQGTEISKQKNSASGISFDTSYIQAMTGAKMKIEIPYLFNIAKSKNISIAKAEVIIRPMAGTSNNTFPVPTRLLLLQPNATTGLNSGIIDLLEPFYGGAYNATLNEYKFNITRHMQSLFIDYQRNGVDNNRGLFVIVPTDYPVYPSRLFVDTRKKIPGMGIEFKLYYAEL